MIKKKKQFYAKELFRHELSDENDTPILWNFAEELCKYMFYRIHDLKKKCLQMLELSFEVQQRLAFDLKLEGFEIVSPFQNPTWSKHFYSILANSTLNPHRDKLLVSPSWENGIYTAKRYMYADIFTIPTSH